MFEFERGNPIQNAFIERGGNRAVTMRRPAKPASETRIPSTPKCGIRSLWKVERFQKVGHR
jgi:hypothetical protein